jgi:2-C-methyl-D-erythritol 4-phosphate cytidylyltransferase
LKRAVPKKKAVAIIVGAGEGVRMGSDTRKQYMVLRDRPVLAHTVLAFEKCDAIEGIFLVIPAGDDVICKTEIIDPLHLKKPLTLVPGGTTRQESVFNGLRAVDGQSELVAIHDGVRPLVRIEDISRCLEIADLHGGCILALASSDTVKTVDVEDRVVVTLKRHMIRMAQTPQAFRYDLILGAHTAARKESYVGTDDAELAERCGEVVKVIEGDPYNIKITTPEDLKFAEVLMTERV